MSRPIEITVFRKSRGVLSKEIRLEDGKVKSDGAACCMREGTAYRESVDSVEDLAELIDGLKSDEALALGRLRAGLPDKCKVVVRADLNGEASNNTIARTGDFLSFAPGKRAFLLCDHDRKGMPDNVSSKLKRQRGFWKTLVRVFPGLDDAASVERRSTSAGLYHARTNRWLGGSLNRHVYLLVKDGADIERALKTMHDRLWLAGLGYYVIGAAGQMLDRSLVDASVYGPERLVFEGPPILVPPVAQDAEKRRARFYNGSVIDTRAVFPPLTDAEAQRLAELKAEAKRKLQPAADRKRQKWVKEYARERGLPDTAAAHIAAQALNHTLEADFELCFDDPDLGNCTVAEVLADADTFVGETLADPLEGVAYGRGKAKVLMQRDGKLMINSFARGGASFMRWQRAIRRHRTQKQTHTRNGLDWTKRFAGIARAFAIPGLAIIDGEAVVIKDGRTNFSELQAALAGGRQGLIEYYAFDLLYLDGCDLRAVPQIERKRLLKDLFDRHGLKPPLHYSEHLVGDGPEMFAHAAKLNWEGVVSKNPDAPYRSDRNETGSR
jgi:hypothetical protein